jgi:hypothetical protein
LGSPVSFAEPHVSTKVLSLQQAKGISICHGGVWPAFEDNYDFVSKLRQCLEDRDKHFPVLSDIGPLALNNRRTEAFKELCYRKT